MAPLAQDMAPVSQGARALAISTPTEPKNPLVSSPIMALDTLGRQRTVTNLTRVTMNTDQGMLGELDSVTRPAGECPEIRPLVGTQVLLAAQRHIPATIRMEVVLREELDSETNHPIVATIMIMRKAGVCESTLFAAESGQRANKANVWTAQIPPPARSWRRSAVCSGTRR